MRRVLMIMTTFLISVTLFAGPFGVEFGWTLDELEASGVSTLELDRDGNVISYMITPTKPHSALALYTVFIDDEFGIAQIRALSTLCYSEYSVRSAYDTLRAQLEDVYGEPYYDLDEIKWNSEWDGAENFIRSIVYGDRSLIAQWYPDDEESNISGITLGLIPITDDSVFVAVEYFSSDFDKVLEKHDKSDVSAL